MSWADVCGNCGRHRADCDCGNWSIVSTKNKIKMENENIDTIQQHVSEMSHLVFLRNSFLEYTNKDQQIISLSVKVVLGVEEYDTSLIGHGKMLEFLIYACNEKINELKKMIAEDLYPSPTTHK